MPAGGAIMGVDYVIKTRQERSRKEVAVISQVCDGWRIVHANGEVEYVPLHKAGRVWGLMCKPGIRCEF